MKEMFCNPTHLVDVIFNKLEDLLDFSVAAHTDYSEQQLINIAYGILNNTSKYQHYIQEWSRMPAACRSWANFKTHFHQAHQELCESGDLQVRDTHFHLANLVQEVIDGVQSALHPPDTQDTPQVLQHMANNAAQRQMMPQLMAQMVQMMDQLNTIQQRLQDSSASSLSSTATALHLTSTVGHTVPVHTPVLSAAIKKRVIKIPLLLRTN